MEEAEWVMENGSRIFRGEAMYLEWWSPSTGCVGRTDQDSEVWIRVFGLPLHLWTVDIMKRVGDRCRGFVVMDKETTHRKDLRWARILGKNSSSRRPSSVNLLAGARSYELQIWWEIHPRVVEVYPHVYRTKGLLIRSSEEDEEKPGPNDRVRGAQRKSFNTFQEMKCSESQQKALGLSGSDGGASQCPKGVGIHNVGPVKCYVSQSNLGIRERNEGDTQVSERVSKKGHFGLQTERNTTQNPNPRQVTGVGQSPISHRDQTKRSKVKNAVDNQRAKSMGLSVEKTKIKEKYILVSLQKSKDSEGEEKSSKRSAQRTCRGRIRK